MAEQTTASSKYRVLRQVAVTDEKYDKAWVVVGSEIEARSQQEAIKAAVEKLGDTTGAVYVAVPERSWMPAMVRPKVVTTFAFEDPEVAPVAPADPVTP